jgi:hypothetical protein
VIGERKDVLAALLNGMANAPTLSTTVERIENFMMKGEGVWKGQRVLEELGD